MVFDGHIHSKKPPTTMHGVQIADRGLTHLLPMPWRHPLTLNTRLLQICRNTVSPFPVAQ